MPDQMKRFIAVCLTLVLLGVACGGRQQPSERAPNQSPPKVGALNLPEPLPASPAFKVEVRDALSDARTKLLSHAPGVAVVAALGIERTSVDILGRNETLDVGWVDPLRFRSVAPASTREAEFVWSALLTGEAVVAVDTAEQLDLRSNARMRIAGRPIEVGAFADNGAPNLADVIVASHVGRKVHLGPEDALVIGAKPGVSLDALERALERRLRGTGAVLKPLIPESPTPIVPAAAPQQVGTAEGDLIGRMTFRILRNGFIEPDARWVEASIATAEVPILGRVTCHRLLLPQLHAALSEIQRRGLSKLVDPGDYGGCYVPRFIDRDPSRALSMHAFGLAADLNVTSNQLGTEGDMDPRVVDIFERWGFAWGGRWSRPDPMHFELARLIQL
jgi:hypothetical protein